MKDDRLACILQAKLPFKDQDRESRVLEVFNRLLDRLESVESRVVKLEVARRSNVPDSSIH